MPRGKEIAGATRVAIYRVYQTEGAAEALTHGRRCGVCARSVYKIIASEGAFPESSHPGSARRWDEEQVAALIRRVEEEPGSTLQELAEWGVGQGHPTVTVQTVASYLSRELITYKLTRLEPTMSNAPGTKEARREYCEWYLGVDLGRCVFIDETGICLWTARMRMRGRARVGVTPRTVVTSQREANRSVAMAIAMNRGVVLSQIRMGAFDRARFSEFLADLCAALHAGDLADPVLIMDNCRIHSREDLEELRASLGVEFRFLPPWSPMLNPIEEVFADFKRNVRTELSMVHAEELREIDVGPRGDKGRRRGAVLERAYATAVGVLEVGKINNHIAHTNSAVGRALRMEDL